jgi:uncharacterized membrane protein
MRLIPRFVKATIVGGLLFVIPLILMGVVIRRGLDIVAKVVRPLAAHFPDHRILGVGLTTILSAVVILLASFVLGLAAQTAAGRRVREWLEWTVLGKVPGYAMVKGVLQGSTGLEGEDAVPVVLARLEDAWQLAFLVETHSDGQRVVYVPGAPSPASGSIYFLPADRVRATDIPMTRALAMIRRFGGGSEELLRGRLSAPSDASP